LSRRDVIALFHQHFCNAARSRRSHLRRRLFRLYFKQRLAGADRVADLHLHIHYISAGYTLAERRQEHFGGHAAPPLTVNDALSTVLV
jgi:hypothetical protein